MVGRALERLPPADGSLLFIENVGNLVCPAAFDLGEACKVVVLSVTEGEDKPLKYPDMFHAARLMLLNKVDLLPYVAFDVERCVEYVRRVNPDIDDPARVRDDRRGHGCVARLARAGRARRADLPRGNRRRPAPPRIRARGADRSPEGLLMQLRAPATPVRYGVRVHGTVQGVGFRPFVYRLASRTGTVRLGAQRRARRRHRDSG